MQKHLSKTQTFIQNVVNGLLKNLISIIVHVVKITYIRWYDTTHVGTGAHVIMLF